MTGARHVWSGWAAVLAVGITAALVGCTTTRPVPVPEIIDDETRLPWAVNEPWFVVVRRQCRTLDVYHQGVRVGSYPAVFGVGGRGRKLYEGDLRTPVGLYKIIDIHPHARWTHFMLLDYPNLDDRRQYAVAVSDGRVPVRGDRYAGIGGAIGIHGTDRPEVNERGEDWTLGCISLSNDDIQRLVALVPVGTFVLIED